MVNSRAEKPGEDLKCFVKRTASFYGNVSVLMLCILVFGGTVYADSGSSEDISKLVISSVQTAGTVSIGSTQVLAKVRSKTGELFDPSVAEEDAKRIAKLPGVEYSYYNTAVKDNTVQLTFVIVEKNLARSITFSGNKVYKPDALKKKLDFKEGDYLDPIIAKSGEAAIADFYKEKGYAFAVVTLDSGEFNLGKVVYKIEEGPRVRVAKVSFSGNKRLKSSALKKAVKISTTEFLVLPAYYIESKLEKDVKKLEEAYYEKGFLDVKIEIKREFNADKTKIRITFEIVEGDVYAVEKITVYGNKFFDEQKLRSETKLVEGKTYSEKRADLDAKNLLKLYRETGFIDAKVERKREFVPGSKVAVRFEINEGERFKIGQVNITGNDQTQDKVVRRVLDEYDFKPTNWYNADIARGDSSGPLEKNVKRMTYVESVAITPYGDTPGEKDAQVSVVEGQTGQVMLGAGVASDSGMIGQFIFEQRNFDISDKPKDFEELITGRAFKGAGQNLRIALQPGTEVSEYSISFTEPYMWNKPISMDIVGSSWERERESYDEQRTKGLVSFEKRYKNNWRRSIGFRVENVNVGSIDSDAPQEIIDVTGGNLLAGIKIGFTKDLTDDKIMPSKGYIFSTSYEQVGGDYTFGIIEGSFTKFRTIYEDLAERKTILATRFRAGSVVGDAPPFEKFYAGGASTIRGFEYRGVSTRGLQTNVANPKKKDPIGSDWIFLAGAEVVMPVVGENISALFFVDTGTVDTGNYRAAVGTGIQILLPQLLGPVPMRFEIATPFMKDSGDDTQVFSFSVGRLF